MTIREGHITANGLNFRYLESGPEDGPLALLLHGFPEGAESWSPQLEAMGAAGRHAVAPDMRGYGGTDAPEAEDDYAMPHLVADVSSLIEGLGGSADLAGHDWGALVGWQVAIRHPELLRTWSALSVAHPAAFGRALRKDPDQQARSEYINLFRTHGKAEEVLLAHGQQRLRAMYRMGPNPEAFPADVVDTFATSLSRPGRLTAGLNYYRANLGRPPGESEPPPLVTVPTLMIWGDSDPALGRRAVDDTGALVSGPYRLEVLAGAGHWLQVERPAEVSAMLVEHTRRLGVEPNPT
jgi:pimeloyl-ACP methyl ester carboxylesterase